MNLLAKLVRSAGLGVAVKACNVMADRCDAFREEMRAQEATIRRLASELADAARADEAVRLALITGHLGAAQETTIEAATRVVSERGEARRATEELRLELVGARAELAGLRGGEEESERAEETRALEDRIVDLRTELRTKIERIARLEQMCSAANERAEVHARDAIAARADADAMAKSVVA